MDSNITANKLKEISIENDNFYIQILINEDYFKKIRKCYMSLQSRDKERIINLDSSYLDKIDDYQVVEASLNLEDKLFEKDIWDLYIFVEEGDGKVKCIRTKSGYCNIHFLSVVTPHIRKMVYAYTTNKGNVSFKIVDYTMISEVESVQISNSKIEFSGYFNFPPLYRTSEYKNSIAKLCVINSSTEEEIEFPIESFERHDLFKSDQMNRSLKCGIKGSIDLKDQITNDHQKLKLFLKIRLQKADESIEEYKSNIKLTYFSDKTPKSIVYNENERYKVSVKPSKKARNFIIQISKYDLKKELINKVNVKWKNIRRGNKLKKIYKVAFKILGKLPVKKNLIVFESFLGKQYSDSPRAIYEYMLENNLNDQMYWSFDRRHIQYFENRGIKAVRRFSVKWLFLMARANYWVTNSRLPLWLPKPPHTIYVQTWHGTPLKKLAADMEQVQMPGTNTKKYKRNFLKEASKWDYLVSPNRYSTDIFKRAFCFNGNMLETGYPRNDILINSNNEEKILCIKKKLEIPSSKKVILYAPTWRDNQFYEKGRYKFDLKMDVELMKKELKEDYVIILRLHYLVAENLDLTGFESFIYDFSKHEDIRELYLISDILITDYSSVFFDYANLKRPMIFYVYDIEDYRDNLRGFYFDFEEKAPGPLVRTTTGILDEIRKLNKDFNQSENIQEFYEKFCYLEDGKASERVVREIFY